MNSNIKTIRLEVTTPDGRRYQEDVVQCVKCPSIFFAVSMPTEQNENHDHVHHCCQDCGAIYCNQENGKCPVNTTP